MDATTTFMISGMTGCVVDLVLCQDGQTRLIRTDLVEPEPLRLQTSIDHSSQLQSSQRVMLLAQHEGLSMRADGTLGRVWENDNALQLEVCAPSWELLERRRHIRYPMSISVAMRTIIREGLQAPERDFNGTTLDLSISGAFVRATELPKEGELVETRMNLDGAEARILAVIARLSPGLSGAGLHFVEYLGDSQRLLDSFLKFSG